MMSRDPLGAAEQAATAEEIVATLRHDLRNCFGTIRNAAFFLKRKIAREQAFRDDPRVEQFIHVIDDEAVAASALVDDVAQSRIPALRRPVSASARACVHTAAACARIAEPGIRVDVDAADGTVELDPAELALAVRCLVENAAESMAGGGVVTLRGSVVDARYRIEVGDTGAGVPEADREVITRPFYTTKPGRLGLGLNIAARVARRYFGTLSIERGAPCGTRACIELPLGPQRDPGGPGDPGAGGSGDPGADGPGDPGADGPGDPGAGGPAGLEPPP
ncbi:sensor histidine kinase [Sorangium sp. So ce131]|uniref:sensor histidine kinase n=1 Tax=Sorangium sp. So ce131 TaxID=3133282 RepID=UPI003F6019B6